MTLSPEIKRIFASAPTDTRYVETLQFTHPGFLEEKFLTNDVEQWDFLLEDGTTSVTFERVPFQLILPSHSDGGRQDLQIAICNIGQEMMDELERAVQIPLVPIKCTYRIYIDQTGSLPQNDPPTRLTIKNVDARKEEISTVATRADVLNKSFPSDIYRITNFPGLDR